MDGTTCESAEASELCACEDNCQHCGSEGDLNMFEAAPNNCIMCKSIITMPTTSSFEAMAGFCDDVNINDYFEEILDEYY